MLWSTIGRLTEDRAMARLASAIGPVGSTRMSFMFLEHTGTALDQTVALRPLTAMIAPLCPSTPTALPCLRYRP